MKQNILFDTSCGSLNMGDYIICESVEKELKEILANDFLIKIATHTPITHFYQNLDINPLYNYCKHAHYKFFAGTNIIQYRLFLRPWANFNANVFNYAPYKRTILVGAGSDKNRKWMDPYTKFLFKKVLSREYIHSARDQKTKELLESLGLKAINTGCATMWSLTEDHCKSIPKSKAKNVIFTLTDYRKDPENDKKLIEVLRSSYEKTYFWVQGTGDYEYLSKLTDTEKIDIIPPSLEEYRKVLTNHKNIDYVGTRLHAGIFAMQNKVRSIIIAVDNRANDIKESYNINAIAREEIEGIRDKIYETFDTKININRKNIEKWKSQFLSNE